VDFFRGSSEEYVFLTIFSGFLYQIRVPDSDSGKPDGIKKECKTGPFIARDLFTTQRCAELFF
jgi:hypothetical protein